MAVNAPEAQRRSKETWRAKAAAGEINFRYGERHHNWRGGFKAFLERNKDKILERQRAYRRSNPDKERDRMARRRDRLGAKPLPRGWVDWLMKAQRCKCAVCRVNLKAGYHIDHIMPLSKGGRHEKENVQLLCPACNVRKSAKHPVDFMRSRGYLL